MHQKKLTLCFRCTKIKHEQNRNEVWTKHMSSSTKHRLKSMNETKNGNETKTDAFGWLVWDHSPRVLSVSQSQ